MVKAYEATQQLTLVVVVVVVVDRFKKINNTDASWAKVPRKTTHCAACVAYMSHSIAMLSPRR